MRAGEPRFYLISGEACRPRRAAVNTEQDLSLNSAQKLESVKAILIPICSTVREPCGLMPSISKNKITAGK